MCSNEYLIMNQILKQILIDKKNHIHEINMLLNMDSKSI
jgi:hypothetical protein